MSGATIELDWLSRWNLYTPNKVAIRDVLQSANYTYGDLFRISNGLIPYLASLEIKKGDRVAVFAGNRVETILLFFTLQRMGAILVPINFRLSASELSYILKDSQPKALFYDELTRETVHQASQALPTRDIQSLQRAIQDNSQIQQQFEFQGQLQDPCMILYTSGTTGHPKGVVITHETLLWNSLNTTLSLNLSSADSMVSFLPLFHTGGWNVLLTPFIHRGASFVFLPAFDAEKILQLCESEQISVLFGVPTTLAMMAKVQAFETVKLDSLRFAVVGGEPMPLSLIQTWHTKGVPIRQGFGMTECGPNCFSLSHEDAERKIGSIGRPNFYVEVRVVDELNQEVGFNQVGELLLRGPMCMKEYWRNPIASAETFLDGWLRTGDLVRRDEDNYFYVVGRKKDMFISGGENVYPAEVEKILCLHPEVDEAAVVGVPDTKWGEVGQAFVVPKKGRENPSPMDLTGHCMRHLAKFKVPKHFEFLPALPKGSSGKILKKDLLNHGGILNSNQEGL